ncbi:hypothetical protein CSA80_00735 [Candidatus Saccharibacteria bacterium]|nr:MAG: hypothetical protein CSA80_00735 [Candidatus Saccharibacteria bacterium]
MQANQKTHRLRLLFVLLLWVAALLLVFSNQQRLVDWWKLRGYEPSARIAAIADRAKMNDLGERLFFVNKPQILEGSTFTQTCPVGAEKTVVLGCYKGGDNGIFLSNVQDERLDGVVEVTAAHEMLHAAYERLSSGEKERVDGMLQAFYRSGLNDERIAKTIDSYRQTEPNEIVNEMHSIFATEVVELPAELETYYARYFTDRRAVAEIAARYQAEFTSRRKAVADYDQELSVLKQTIETNRARLETERAYIANLQAELDALQAAQDIAAYNNLVAPYNQAVRAYNNLLGETRAHINAYNAIVAARNAIALEEQQLVRALSPESLPAQE